MHLSILLKFIFPSVFLATAVTILYLIVAKTGSSVTEVEGGVGTVTTV